MENLFNYLQSINGEAEVHNWLNTTGKKSLSKNLTNYAELEHIIDYLVSDDAPKRLRKMSFKDAKRKTEEWMLRNQKKGRNLIDDESDLETIYDFNNGNRIVKLKTKKALQREGFLMSHCVGGYDAENGDYDIYSYRDNKNEPHATFEVRKNNEEIVQIKGKGNGPIHPKYINPILIFLKHIGMDVRASDMQNLGYYHIHKEHLEFLNQLVNPDLTVIGNETYLFERL